MRQREWRIIAGEVPRFCLVGGLIVLLNNAIVVALTEFVGLHYLASIALCTAIMTVAGFFLHRQWTFHKAGKMHWAEFARFVAGVVGGLGVAMLLTWALVQLGLPYYLASLIAAAFMAPVSFVLHRVWSFELSGPVYRAGTSHGPR